MAAPQVPARLTRDDALALAADLPDLNLGGFLRDSGGVARTGIAPSRIPVVRPKAKYIQFPPGITNDERGVILWTLVTSNPVNTPMTTTEQWCWLLTALDVIAPGFGTLMTTSTDLTVIRANDDDLKSIVPVRSKGTAHNNDVGDLPRFRHIKALPTASPPEPGNEDAINCELIYAANWFGILLFGIGKRATSQNINAFQERRPRALFAKAGKADGTSPFMDKAVMPSEAHLNWIAGLMAMAHTVRIDVTKELIRWVNTAPTFACEVVATHIKLWEGAGLNHIRMVRTLVLGYGPALTRIPILRTELRAALRTWQAYSSDTDPFKAFSRVIYGDRESFGRSRDYANLLMIARDVIARTDPKFNQYATGSSSSPLMPMFEEICEALNLRLPASVNQVTSAPAVA